MNNNEQKFWKIVKSRRQQKDINFCWKKLISTFNKLQNPSAEAIKFIKNESNKRSTYYIFRGFREIGLVGYEIYQKQLRRKKLMRQNEILKSIIKDNNLKWKYKPISKLTAEIFAKELFIAGDDPKLYQIVFEPDKYVDELIKCFTCEYVDSKEAAEKIGLSISNFYFLRKTLGLKPVFLKKNKQGYGQQMYFTNYQIEEIMKTIDYYELKSGAKYRKNLRAIKNIIE